MAVITLLRDTPVAALVPSARAFREMDVRAPRYSSYPTADRFVEAFDADAYQGWLGKRPLTARGPLSLYVHLPFCASDCHFCSCNRVVTGNYSRALRYLRCVEQEARLVRDALGSEARIGCLHLGGGTPTYYHDTDLVQLMRSLRATFPFEASGDFSIEVDPRVTAPETIGLLAGLGFNRISVGVQDLDPDVQRAVHREQAADATERIVDAARAAGVRSVAIELMCGLPRQSVERFGATIARIAALRPDRVAIYPYAHRPQRHRSQRHIREIELPSAEERFAICSMATSRLVSAGYTFIGLDHFALPEDGLAQAHRAGTLRRDFQGYSCRPDGDLIGLGASAISRVGPVYAQNLLAPADYGDAIEQGMLPVARGIELGSDDLVRRAVIMGLQCQGSVSFESIEIAHLVDFRTYFHAELEALAPMVEQGLLVLDDEWLSVTSAGRLFLRAICAVFDRYLADRRARAGFSGIL